VPVAGPHLRLAYPYIGPKEEGVMSDFAMPASSVRSAAAASWLRMSNAVVVSFIIIDDDF
jgi:hypothetical protein